MEEVVVSYGEGVDMEAEKETMNEEKKVGSRSMVRWEMFLPKMALRVLLVEADDSTRRIVGALLRKCNYKVATVSDGLKAWEVVKSRPQSIDLILTEIELPSISGYALLTLIMEHEICKNIPVIMMSKHDSVSTVYKCMLRGAADFLVKPIRINELKNLWQHVWRRQSLNRGVEQEKLEATAENSATSDYSSSSKACAPRQEDCIKKGSDAQSSSGKPGLEAQSASMAEASDHTPPNQSNCANSGQNFCIPDSAVQLPGSDASAYNGNAALHREGWVEQQSHGGNVNLFHEESGSTDVLANSSRKAIDLIGALDNHSRHNLCSNEGADKFESFPPLDLSLWRSHSDVLENKATYEKKMLNHSNASAFTRYVNKTLHKEDKVNPDDRLSDNAPDSNSNAKDFLLPYDMNLTIEVETEYHNACQRLFPIPLPIRGLQVDLSTSPAPNSANRQLNSFHQLGVVDVTNNGRHKYHRSDQSKQEDQMLESLEDQDGVIVGRFESGKEQSRGLSLQRSTSIQREAALSKFRLKRKERCYEKKVRYESRKKLAEKRPRVKGQFVRQVPPDPPPPSNNSGRKIQ